jgi:hypothetical protein
VQCSSLLLQGNVRNQLTCTTTQPINRHNHLFILTQSLKLRLKWNRITFHNPKSKCNNATYLPHYSSKSLNPANPQPDTITTSCHHATICSKAVFSITQPYAMTHSQQPNLVPRPKITTDRHSVPYGDLLRLQITYLLMITVTK